MANETQKAVLQRLAYGASTAGALAETCKLAPSDVMQALDAMDEVGLVRTEIQGTRVLYKLGNHPPVVAAKPADQTANTPSVPMQVRAALESAAEGVSPSDLREQIIGSLGAMHAALQFWKKKGQAHTVNGRWYWGPVQSHVTAQESEKAAPLTEPTPVLIKPTVAVPVAVSLPPPPVVEPCHVNAAVDMHGRIAVTVGTTEAVLTPGEASRLGGFLLEASSIAA